MSDQIVQLTSKNGKLFTIAMERGTMDNCYLNERCPKCGKFVGVVVGDYPQEAFCDCNKQSYASLIYGTTGWECPRCHKINAPWMQHCDCQPPVTVSTALPDDNPLYVAANVVTN